VESESNRQGPDIGTDEGTGMPWYTDYFDEDYFSGREAYLESERTGQEVEFVIERLGLLPAQRILDLCCGQGRHCVALALRGFRLTGLDLSQHLLDLARQATKEAGVHVDLVRSDMRDIPFHSCFDGAINMFTAFGYLESDEEDNKVLCAVLEALKPGGAFLMDTMNREWLVRNFRPTDWGKGSNGTLIVSERELDPTDGRIRVKETLIRPDASRRERGHVLRLYSYTELAAMMGSAGFRIEGVWGSFDGSAYGLDSRRMIILARRP